MRASWRLWAILFLMPIQLVTGNQGSIAGSCPCDSKLPDSLNPTQWRVLITNLRGYESCQNYIRFHLPKRTLCSSSKNPLVQKLRTCFDNHECRFTRTYQSGNQGTQDYPTSRIQGHSRPFTTTHSFAQTNQSTRIQLREMRSKYLSATTNTSLENSSTSNLKWEGKKGQMDQLGTSAIYVSCLLGIVFVIIGALAYVFCRNRVALVY